MSGNKETGAPTGKQTTGHEWDGIQELNNPLPRWWLYILYATILWSVGYWIVYPSWPLLNDYTHGAFGYSQRAAVLAEIEATRAARATQASGLPEASYDAIRAAPAQHSLAIAIGKSAFGDNCAACHGAGATGRPGYPNLQDDEWLWGGQPSEIERTLRFGVRTSHSETRLGEMPAFGGANGVLKRDEIELVANYTLSLTGKAFDARLNLDEGRRLFGQNCASCHGAEGRGNREVGAPNLTDAIWLYGSERKDVIASIENGRRGVMPHWEGRLDPLTIKSLVLYIHSLGGGR